MPKGFWGFQPGNKIGLGNKHRLGKSPWNKGMQFPNKPRKPIVFNICKDCDKKIHKTSVRCRPCSKMKSLRNPNVRQKRWARKINGIYLQSLATRIRDLSEYVEWRMKVFKRDGFICQSCMQTGKLLHAHHIKYMSSILIENNIDSIEKAIVCHELWNLKNGITFCNPCHKLTHRTNNENFISLKQEKSATAA